MKKLAIITSHPIQYNAPLFRLLSERNQVVVKVFYTWSQAKDIVFDPGFNRMREWDLPLLEGYNFEFVQNTATVPGSHHFNGIRNPDLIQSIENWSPNAILVYGWSFHSHLSCLRYFKRRVPVFFRGDSNLLNEKNGLQKVLRRLFLRWVYKHVDMAFYVGSNNREYFCKHGLKKTQLIPAFHAVDNIRFASISLQEQEEVERLKQTLSISDSDFVILFAGKLEPVKNPHFILMLAKQLKEWHFKFLIVGNGPLEQDLKNAAKNDSRIIFSDFQNQSKMPLIYRLGSIFLMCSTSETWGLAANEAMACGLPVVLSAKVGSAPDLVGDKETGLVFSPGDVDSVAGYLCKLQKDETLYRQTCENAKKHIQSFNFEKLADAIEREMQKLAAN